MLWAWVDASAGNQEIDRATGMPMAMAIPADQPHLKQRPVTHVSRLVSSSPPCILWVLGDERHQPCTAAGGAPMIESIVANAERRRTMLVSEGMSEDVLTIGPGHSLREAAAAMWARQVGAAVVHDPEAQAPGVITERDVLQAVARRPGPRRRIGRRTPHREPHLRARGLVARARRRHHGLGRVPPPRGRRRLRGGRSPLDARHRQGVVRRGRRLRRARSGRVGDVRPWPLGPGPD